MGARPQVVYFIFNHRQAVAAPTYLKFGETQAVQKALVRLKEEHEEKREGRASHCLASLNTMPKVRKRKNWRKIRE